MKRLFIFIAVLCLALSFADSVDSTETTGTLDLEATVSATCSIAGGAINFGDITTSAQAISTVTIASVTCSNTAQYRVGGGKGTSSGGQRHLSFGLNTIQYSLWKTAGSVEFGDSCVGTSTYPAGSCTDLVTGTGSPQAVTIEEARVQSGAGKPMGTYTDNVLLTVVY